MPIFAAGLGVLGGVGGAFVGGSVANEGQREGFKRQRAAAMQDLRIEAYANFLGTAEGLVGGYAAGSTDAERRTALVKLLSAKARGLIVQENPDVGNAAYEVATAITGDGRPKNRSHQQELADYKAAAEVFVALARHEISESER